MPRILQLVTNRKGAYRRAKGERTAEEESQLNLFAQRQAATVVRLDAALSPFDSALMKDRTGAGSDARDAYLQAVRDGDRVADACCNLGILEAADGAYDDAVEWFARSLAADPEHVEAHYNLGCLYLDMEMFAPARVHLAVAAARDPESAELQFNLAVALAGVGQFAASVAALRQFRKLSPDPDRDESAQKLLGELEKALQERA
ncbi:MAG: tetratricopeptide repeat protein [Rhodothermales bacterium]|nr:tetratricopeptide repeat protein [Rhodothermales bacterium]MBO6779205.1 tetratricopeptide repeat protein [Rhodothermales bacterium]